MRRPFAEIQLHVPPGVGIALNSLYINPASSISSSLWGKKWNAKVCQSKDSALLPASEKVAEIISALRDAGIKRVAFKPGPVEGIRQAVAIAATGPDYPIIWNGRAVLPAVVIRTKISINLFSRHTARCGRNRTSRSLLDPDLEMARAFGHILAESGRLSTAYSLCRSMVCSLDGQWLRRRLIRAILSSSLVKAPGVEDNKCEQTYKGETGGLLIAQSELGEPIHKIATRAIKLWKEFDETMVKLAKDKRQAGLNANADSMIEKLNGDFAKPRTEEGWNRSQRSWRPYVRTYEETASFARCTRSTSLAGSTFRYGIFLEIGYVEWKNASQAWMGRWNWASFKAIIRMIQNPSSRRSLRRTRRRVANFWLQRIRSMSRLLKALATSLRRSSRSWTPTLKYGSRRRGNGSIFSRLTAWHISLPLGCRRCRRGFRPRPSARRDSSRTCRR